MSRPPIEETLKKPHYGRCRICKRYSRFTKEHVPPEKAINQGPVVVFSHQTRPGTNRVSMRPSHESADGVFLYSLCKRCNNQTGNRYGSDYSEFIRAVDPYAVPKNANEIVQISFPTLHPLRIIKQVTSMILSTSAPTDFRRHELVGAPGRAKSDLAGIDLVAPSKDEQCEIFEKLRLFVKRRDSNDFPKEVRVYLFAGVGRRIGFQTGIFFRLDLDTRRAFVAIVTGLYPVHWIFTIGDGFKEDLTDVTDWTEYSYKQPLKDDIEIPIRWFSGHTPLDFRSPQDLLTSNFINSMKFEGFIPSPGISKEELLNEAIYFARVLGRVTPEGYVISNFECGTFYEFDGLNGWLEGATRHEAIKELEARVRAR